MSRNCGARQNTSARAKRSSSTFDNVENYIQARAIQTFDLTSRNRSMRFEKGAHFISAYKLPELIFGYSSEKRITCGAQSSFSFKRCNEDLYFFREMLRALKFGRFSGRAFYNRALSDRQNLETCLKFGARSINECS